MNVVIGHCEMELHRQGWLIVMRYTLKIRFVGVRCLEHFSTWP